ncbi:hypothetical protein DBR42_19885, partial [Pelomonas sp. HMWF004]
MWTRLFLPAWIGLALLMVGSLGWLPPEVGDPGKTLSREAYLLTMVMPVALIGLCSGALVRWLGRRSPGLISMPHRDYWLAEERREVTLARLGEHLSALGLGLVLLIGGIHLQLLFRTHPKLPQPPGEVWAAGGGALVVLQLLWCWRLYRLFPAPPAAQPQPVER